MREGPWDSIFQNLFVIVPMRPVLWGSRWDAQIIWEVKFKRDKSVLIEGRFYKWDWEGDGNLALREALYAAQVQAEAGLHHGSLECREQ